MASTCKEYGFTTMELRIKPSSPLFEDVYRLADLIAQMSNVVLFYDMREVTPEEQAECLDMLKAAFEEKGREVEMNMLMKL